MSDHPDRNKVVRLLPGTGKRDPRALIEIAREFGDELESLAFIGRDKDGCLRFSMTHEKNSELLWDLESAKLEVLHWSREE